METKIGQFVTSLAGHDKGQLYVIVGQEEDFLYLSDGRLKAPDKPKKKRRKHVQLIDRTVDATLLNRLAAGEKVMPEELKFAIKLYVKACNK